MLNWFSKEFRSFTRQSEGVAALEFAMVFMPVTILILGTLQTVMMMLYSYDLDMATTETVRMFRTGFAQQIGSDSKKMIDTPAELRLQFCQRTILLNCDRNNIQVEIFATPMNNAAGFSGIANAIGLVDPHDPSQGYKVTPSASINYGVPNTTVLLMRAYAEYSAMTSIWDPSANRTNGGRSIITSAAVFVSEPDGSQAQLPNKWDPPVRTP